MQEVVIWVGPRKEFLAQHKKLQRIAGNQYEPLSERGIWSIFSVSEIGKKGAVSEQFAKPAPSVLSKEGFLCGPAVC